MKDFIYFNAKEIILIIREDIILYIYIYIYIYIYYD